jgi:hypothetical protein
VDGQIIWLLTANRIDMRFIFLQRFDGSWVVLRAQGISKRCTGISSRSGLVMLLDADFRSMVT